MPTDDMIEKEDDHYKRLSLLIEEMISAVEIFENKPSAANELQINKLKREMTHLSKIIGKNIDKQIEDFCEKISIFLQGRKSLKDSEVIEVAKKILEQTLKL